MTRARSFALLTVSTLLLTGVPAVAESDSFLFEVASHTWNAWQPSWYTGPHPVRHDECPVAFVAGTCLELSPGTKLYFAFPHARLDNGKGIDAVSIRVEGERGRCNFELLTESFSDVETAEHCPASYVIEEVMPAWGSIGWRLTIECSLDCPTYLKRVTVRLGYHQPMGGGASMTPDPVLTVVDQTTSPGTITACVDWQVWGSYWYPEVSGVIAWGDGSSTPIHTSTTTEYVHPSYSPYYGIAHACHSYEAQLSDYQLTLTVWNDRWGHAYSYRQDMNLVTAAIPPAVPI